MRTPNRHYAVREPNVLLTCFYNRDLERRISASVEDVDHQTFTTSKTFHGASSDTAQGIILTTHTYFGFK